MMKIACLGDSITNLGDDVPTYVQFLGDSELPLTTQNVGLSGSALAIPGLPGANPALSERYVEIHKDADIILIFGGSNDYGQTQFPAPLGDVDSDSTDRHDFCGALRYLIKTLRAEHPKALVVYATPLKRDDVRWYTKIEFDVSKAGQPNRFGKNLIDYRNAGIAICKKLDCPVIDTYAFADLDNTDPDISMTYFLDGVHLRVDGAKKLAAYFTDNLKKFLAARA